MRLTSEPKVTGSINEASRNREDLLGSEGNVECGGDRRLASQDVQERLVAGLDGEDGRSGIKQHGVIKEGRTTEVRTNTDEFDHTGGRSQGGNVSQGRIELEIALERCGSVVLERLLDDGGVGGLVTLDRCQRLGRDQAGREAGSLEVRVLEFCKSLSIELSLELFQDICELCGLSNQTGHVAEIVRTHGKQGHRLRMQHGEWGVQRPKEGQPERR